MAWLIPIAGSLIAACLAYAALNWLELRREAQTKVKVAERLRTLSFENVMEQEAVVRLLREEELSAVPMLRTLLKLVPRIENLRLLMDQGAVRMKVGTFYLLSGVLAVGAGLAVSLFAVPWIFAMVAAAGAGCLPYLYLLRRKKKRVEAFEAGFPEAIDLLARAIRAGHAFSTGFQMIGEECPDPVGEEFRRSFEEQKFGLALKDSMLNLIDRIDLVDLRIFVTALLIQREVGGNLAEVLDKIAYTIRERFKILRQVRVYTAQGRLTGYLLGALPIIMGLLLFAMNQEYMTILFEREIGRVMIAGAAVMQVIGFFLIRRIIHIKV
ncbi:MAG: type II secretion system F family protein [Gemmatimonadota bacterium]